MLNNTKIDRLDCQLQAGAEADVHPGRRVTGGAILDQ